MTPSCIIAEARRLTGTPWVHQGRSPALGLDCVGLPIWCLQQCGWTPRHPERSLRTDYAREADDGELLAIVESECERVTMGEVQEADLLLFKWPRHQYPQHLALANWSRAGQLYMIHSCLMPAYGKCVTEHTFGAPWPALLWGVYRVVGL